MPSKDRGSEHLKVSRRDVVKVALAAGVAAVSGAANADPQAAATEDLSEAEVAAAAKAAGLSYSPKELGQMTGLTSSARKQITAMRLVDVEPDLDPAFRFDPLLPGKRAPKGKSSCSMSRSAFTDSVASAYNGGNVEGLAFATIVELSRLIKMRKVSSTELTRMYLDRLKKFGPKLICVVNLRENQALKDAEHADKEIAAGRYRGPLHGIPWGAKDLLATKGVPTTWGARPYEHQVFDYDATVVRRLSEAGAILIAKLSMGELAMGDIWFGGKTRNPWNTERGSSGSSAGPGSATAAGLVGFAIGTETLGSIVSPSVENGVTGLRPSFGRVSRHGAMPLSWTMDKIGPMCRGVEDCALVLAAIHGPDDLDRTVVDTPFNWTPNRPVSGLKFGIDQAAFDAAAKNPTRGEAYADALKVVNGLGLELKRVKLPPENDAYTAIAETVINCEGAAAFAKLNREGGLAELAQQANDSWPNVFRAGSLTPAADYIQAMRLRHRLQKEWAEVMGDLDGFVTVPFAGPTLVYTNLTGHPTLITRCGMREGLPLSIEFVGGLYKEAEILRMGLAFEQATKWHTQWPDMTKVA